MLTINPGYALRGIIGKDGRFALPGDKSLSHRAALFAAIAYGDSRIENFLVSGVTEAMLNALTALGVTWRLDGATLFVKGRGLEGLKAPVAPIHCGNSATTLRLLAGVLAASGLPAILNGSPGLCKRPMNRIVEPLQAMGVPVEASLGGTAPLAFSARAPGQALRALDFKLPVASAQVKSCLLLAALAGDGPTTLREPGPSRDHTERMLSSMGVQIEMGLDKDNHFIRLIPCSQRLNTEFLSESSINMKPLKLELPADISSAAFLVVAGLITPGSDLLIQGVGLNPTRTGLLDALQAMGADIKIEMGALQAGEPVGDIRVKTSLQHALSSLRGIKISGSLVVRMIDEFPAFAVAAAYAQGTTIVCQAEELRYKESDRISAVCQELRRLGVAVQETPDGFILDGGRPLRGGNVDSHGDHRLAMALSIAGLAAQYPVTVLGDELINESFPEFPSILNDLGAKLDSQRSKPAPLDISPGQFRAIGHQLVDRLADFLKELPDLPVSRGDTQDGIRHALGDRPLPEYGRDPGELLQEAADLLIEHSVFTGHPRHLGYIIGSPSPVGALSDFLAAAINPNLSTWWRSPMASEIEVQAIRWIAELVGYPADCGGLLVSGGNMANFIGFLAARKARTPWDVRSQGLLHCDSDIHAVDNGNCDEVEGGQMMSIAHRFTEDRQSNGGQEHPQKMRVYCSDQTHSWIEKAADIFGLGTDSIHFIASDERQRIRLDRLLSSVREDRRHGDLPLLVVGNAGTTGVGAVDPLPELAAICKEENLWFHVDGAYGAFAAMLPDTPFDLKGLRLADSLALDPHKWLFQPLEAGCAFVRDKKLLNDTFTYHPPYYHFPVQAGQEPVNFYQLGMQNSRGFRALKVWIGLQQAGRSGYQQMLADNIALAERLYQRVSEHPELQAISHNLSVVTFRYVPLDIRAANEPQFEKYLNQLNSDLLARIQDCGEAYISNAVVNGCFLLRACIVNFRTSPADIDRLTEIVVQIGRELDVGRVT